MKKCVICGSTHKDRWDLNRHFKRMHEPKKCRNCDKEYTKYESQTKGAFCSEKCRKENKQKWSKVYAQKPERKEMARINQRKVILKKKEKDPEWGLKPINITQCKNCLCSFTQRGKRRKYCSEHCSQEVVRQYKINLLAELREESKQRKVKKDCEMCGSRFITHRPDTHRFCSLKCRSKNERNKDERKQYKLNWQNEQRKDPSSWFNQPMQRLTARIRGGIRQSLIYKGARKTNTTFSTLDYTKYELMEHIESQFTDGMSWDNMGDWHIDHIRPVSSFSYTSTDCEDFKKCWALNNLQPLWAKDNMSKGDNWDGVVNA